MAEESGGSLLVVTTIIERQVLFLEPVQNPRLKPSGSAKHSSLLGEGINFLGLLPHHWFVLVGQFNDGALVSGPHPGSEEFLRNITRVEHEGEVVTVFRLTEGSLYSLKV